MFRDKLMKRTIGKFEIRLDMCLGQAFLTMSCDGTRLSEVPCVNVASGRVEYLAVCRTVEDVIRCMKQNPKVGDER